MSDKTLFINEYFKRWDRDIGRAQELLNSPTYYLEAILVLSCHIGAFGSLRFPTLQDNEAYKKIVLSYSGMNGFYEQIDLLFFLQWPRSEFRKQGSYLKLKNYTEIANVIEDIFGDENKIKDGIRYLRPQDIMDAVNANPFDGLDRKNLEQHLPLFSNTEMLYRYVRCKAVHSGQFPFVNRVYVMSNGIQYEDNHAITGDILYRTALGILNKLKTECISKEKWPAEL